MDHRQYGHVGNCASECLPGLFRDDDVVGCLVHSKSTSRVMLCLFSERTLVTVSWASKKEDIAVSHCITEADVISPGAQQRIGVLTALS